MQIEVARAIVHKGGIARVYSLSLVRPRLFAEACLLKLEIIVGGSASS